MRTLYVSDLDGTLLRADQRTSAYTNGVINRLVARGMLFSYATARSYQTARKVAAGLDAKIPLIVYNGAMVVDNADGSFLIRNFFDTLVAYDVIRDLMRHGVYPIVYAFIGGEEKFTYVPALCTPGMREYVESRRGDKREHLVSDPEALVQGDVFYLTCIGDRETLAPLYEKYKGQHHCVFQEDLYTSGYWLEIMPQAASKARAISQLKKLLGCDRLVVFGDGKNDIDMFEIADEAYAVENAVPELKAAATAVIGGNNDDGVARWLEARFAAEE